MLTGDQCDVHQLLVSVRDGEDCRLAMDGVVSERKSAQGSF